MGSEKFKLDTADLISLGKNATLVAVAAGLTYLAQNIGHLDLGSATAFVVPVASLVLDSLIKWTKDNTK